MFNSSPMGHIYIILSLKSGKIIKFKQNKMIIKLLIFKNIGDRDENCLRFEYGQREFTIL